ncbi:MAG: ABC transporter permease [Candidatus Izemoplasmatales bacterium]
MSSKMLGYIVKRVLLTIVTIFVIITITFFIMHAIPGGPFLSEKAVTEEVLAALEAKYGLDKPLMTQYWLYLQNVVKLDFGPSLKSRGRDVIDIILEGFAVSGKLGLMAAGIAIVMGIVLGSIAAINRNKIFDNVIMVMTTAFVAMPGFVVGTFLLVLFCVKWPILPANGALEGGLVLPVIALSLYPMSYITRLTRSSMLDVLQQDYIRTARAKGVAKVLIIFKHALKNALIPVITYVGPMIAYIVTGSFVIEKIFSVPGIGREFVSCITNRDYPAIMGTTIFLASLVVIMTLVSDILYKVVDPRIDFS